MCVLVMSYVRALTRNVVHALQLLQIHIHSDLRQLSLSHCVSSSSNLIIWGTEACKASSMPRIRNIHNLTHPTPLVVPHYKSPRRQCRVNNIWG